MRHDYDSKVPFHPCCKSKTNFSVDLKPCKLLVQIVNVTNAPRSRPAPCREILPSPQSSPFLRPYPLAAVRLTPPRSALPCLPGTRARILAPRAIMNEPHQEERVPIQLQIAIPPDPISKRNSKTNRNALKSLKTNKSSSFRPEQKSRGHRFPASGRSRTFAGMSSTPTPILSGTQKRTETHLSH